MPDVHSSVNNRRARTRFSRLLACWCAHMGLTVIHLAPRYVILSSHGISLSLSLDSLSARARCFCERKRVPIPLGVWYPTRTERCWDFSLFILLFVSKRNCALLSESDSFVKRGFFYLVIVRARRVHRYPNKSRNWNREIRVREKEGSNGLFLDCASERCDCKTKQWVCNFDAGMGYIILCENHPYRIMEFLVMNGRMYVCGVGYTRSS